MLLIFNISFQATGFTEGSTPQNWAGIAAWARENNLIFSLSVGPGYDDTRIRPCTFVVFLYYIFIFILVCLSVVS